MPDNIAGPVGQSPWSWGLGFGERHLHATTSHSHAWGHHPHYHVLRAICQEQECNGYALHNTHVRSVDVAEVVEDLHRIHDETADD